MGRIQTLSFHQFVELYKCLSNEHSRRKWVSSSSILFGQKVSNSRNNCNSGLTTLFGQGTIDIYFYCFWQLQGWCCTNSYVFIGEQKNYLESDGVFRFPFYGSHLFFIQPLCGMVHLNDGPSRNRHGVEIMNSNHYWIIDSLESSELLHSHNNDI